MLGIMGYDTTHAGPFSSIFKNQYINLRSSRNLTGVSAVLLWGGIDIHPSLYHSKAHPKNEQVTNLLPIIRDKDEWALCAAAYENNIPIIGVCRGAQLLCAFAGGGLIQDVDGHNSGHEIITHDGNKFFAPAQHHQMMDLRNTTYELLAWSERRSTHYELEDSENTYQTAIPNTDVEPEVVWFPKIQGFAIQYHPEWAGKTEAVTWTLKEIEKKLA